MINKLSDLRIRTFIRQVDEGKAKTKKLSDGGGLYLVVSPAGSALWRVKYRFDKSERLYAAGEYPSVSLEAARAERERVKALLDEGRDPVQQRRLERAKAISASGDTFESVANEWLAKQKAQWSAVHYEKSKRALERDVFPRIGKLPVKEITSPIVTNVVEVILKRGVRETASKVLQHISAIFRLAQARGLRADNPAEPVPEILPPKGRTKRMPAFLTWAELGMLLRKAKAAHLSPSVYMAHRLCAFSVARISNVVEATWDELDLESTVPTWTIPRAKMKARDRHHDHKVILAPAIAAELRQWRDMVGNEGLVFPSRHGRKPISREALEKAYRVTLDLADRHSPHGWRAAFSTLARDQGFAKDVVDLTLDHVHDNEVARAYDRGDRLQERIQLISWWGSQLEEAQAKASLFIASDSACPVYLVSGARRAALRRRRASARPKGLARPFAGLSTSVSGTGLLAAP